jgi:hypothetical protein
MPHAHQPEEEQEHHHHHPRARERTSHPLPSRRTQASESTRADEPESECRGHAQSYNHLLPT